METKKKDKKGFTLVELLLTIAVFSILAAVIIGAINPARRIGLGRDALRKADLQALARALEAYWVENATNLPCRGASCFSYDGSPPTDTNGNGWIPVNVSVQMKTIPIDPINNTNHYYQLYAENSPGSEKFKLQTPMEADSDAAEKDGGVFNDLYEAGTDKSLRP